MTCSFIKRGSPAEEAGLQKQDCVIGVNGVSTGDFHIEKVYQLIADSGKILRIKLIPHVEDEQPNFQSTVEEKFWTNEDPSTFQRSLERKSNEEKSLFALEGDDGNVETFDHTNYEKYCQWIEAKKTQRSPYSENSKQAIKHKKEKARKKEKKSKRVKEKQADTSSASTEQTQFVVTRQDQQDFDENFTPECTFQGEKASVAGAFTGDHNQIFGKEQDDVRGIRSRVRAGIQHFSFEDEQEKIKPEDKGKIIIYTTSLGIHRTISQQCEQVRNIFRGFRVKFEDRDIYISNEHKQELYAKLGLEDGSRFPELPKVYLDGVYIGGAEEVQAMSDCGDLRIRLKEFTKFNIRSNCPTCSGTGQVICHSCHGKTFKKQNRFATLKCGTCYQKGVLSCSDCL